MTREVAVDGKPYAENPHLRFNESEYAQVATPGRVSLFYNMLIGMKKVLAIAIIVVIAILQTVIAATPQVKNVRAMQQYPWGKVYISYEVEGNFADTAMLVITAKDRSSGQIYGTVSSVSGVSYLSGDTNTASGVHKVIWDVEAQGLTIDSANVVFTVAYDEPLYLVVDLSAGANALSYPIFHSESVPSNDWKTTSLVLRRIPAGSFIMNNTSIVTLTKPFYIGVFEVTQKQYSLVMGSNPSGFNGDTLPVHDVSYNMVRGSNNGAQWPSSSAVDSDSFMGRLRTRTGLNFDLPTAAQWEYAYRAGTTTTYYWGDSALVIDDYAWTISNSNTSPIGHTPVYRPNEVGTLKPNAWGLYDMSGNVSEFCLDWVGALSYGSDPKGPSSGTNRESRGGDCGKSHDYCTSSSGLAFSPSVVSVIGGFRLAIPN